MFITKKYWTRIKGVRPCFHLPWDIELSLLSSEREERKSLGFRVSSVCKSCLYF
jgi:hypothetical protein